MIVISLGGSVVRPKSELDVRFVSKLASVLTQIKGRYILVVGGGGLARLEANKVREDGGNEFEADTAAIKITRKNAKEVSAYFENAPSRIPTNFNCLKKMAKRYEIVFMGGTIPGITTDADAVLAAEMLNAERVINISNTAYIYDKDPRKYENAKRYEQMTHYELLKLAIRSDMRRAGTHFIFDSVASKIAYRSNIPLYFVDKKIGEIKKALLGKRHRGTVIVN